jgi:antitoxin component YwqK of YwqJK toxin-antitoxin module
MKFLVSFFLFFSILTPQFLASQPLNQYDENGKQHGKWIKYYEHSEKVRYEGQFEHGIPVGEFKYYYNTSRLQTIANYENKGTVCHTVSYFGNGNKHAEGTYLNRQKEGKWIFYDGFNNVISVEYYSGGKKHGLSSTFLPTGELYEEKNYEYDIVSGSWKRYFINGKPQIEGTIINNKWEGDFVFYHDSGKKNISGKYVNSLRTDDWLYWDNDGRLIKVVTYTNGIETAKKVFQKEKDTDYLDIIESEEILRKIRTGKHDNEPENPFTR